MVASIQNRKKKNTLTNLNWDYFYYLNYKGFSTINTSLYTVEAHNFTFFLTAFFIVYVIMKYWIGIVWHLLSLKDCLGIFMTHSVHAALTVTLINGYVSPVNFNITGLTCTWCYGGVFILFLFCWWSVSLSPLVL